MKLLRVFRIFKSGLLAENKQLKFEISCYKISKKSCENTIDKLRKERDHLRDENEFLKNWDGHY